MKICTQCDIEKPLSDFHKQAKNTKDGRESKCKSCRNEKKRLWRLDNITTVNIKAAKYKLDNKGKVFADCAKRRALKKQAITPTTCLSTIKDIYNNCPEGYHVDHIVPLAKKGKHHQDNLCYLPASLNVAKGAKILEDYPELLKQFNEQVIYPNIKA